MHDAIAAINTVGFPIFVALVLLLRVDRMHSENLKAIYQLIQVVTLLQVAITGKPPAMKE